MNTFESMTLATNSVEVRASRQDTLSRLADDLAHELKNPLNAVVVNLELLRTRLSKGAVDAALERIGLIEHEVRRVHELLEQLLQLLRPIKEPEILVELDAVVQRLKPILEVKAKIARIDLQVELDAQGAPITMRRDLLQLVLLNIALDLVDGLPEQGRLLIRTQRGSSDVAITIEADAALTPGTADAPGSDAGALRQTVTEALIAAAGGRLEKGTAGVEGAGVAFRIVLPRGGISA